MDLFRRFVFPVCGVQLLQSFYHMIYDYIVHLLTLFSSTLGSVAGLSGIRQLGKIPFDLHFAGQVRNYAGSVFRFAPIREQIVSDRGLTLARMSQAVPYFEGILGKQITCSYPPLSQCSDLCVRVFLFDLTGSDLDGAILPSCPFMMKMWLIPLRSTDSMVS